ncbi:MAG: M23 family metallopeptidase [Bacillota bacterium]|nr:M23 family metallopeptidase [Bacillota bacterium]
MKNRKKHGFFTLMVIPHTEESIFSVRIPLFILQALSVIVMASLIFSFFWINSYQVLQDEASDISLLREENRILNEQIDYIAQETEDLKQWVEQMNFLSMEIRQLIELPISCDEEITPSIYFAQNDTVRLLASRGANQVVDRTALNISLLHDSIPGSNENLIQLKEEIMEFQKQQAATPSIWPAQGRVTSGFGSRISPFTRRREFHYGIDIAAPRGTLIIASADGKVTEASYRRGHGNTVIINHGYGIRTMYAHLSSISVSVGDQVLKGQKIGLMGSTGVSTGSHLHYEVHLNGVAVNPRGFLP